MFLPTLSRSDLPVLTSDLAADQCAHASVFVSSWQLVFCDWKGFSPVLYAAGLPAVFALIPAPSSCGPLDLRSKRNALFRPNLQLSMWRSERQGSWIKRWKQDRFLLWEVRRVATWALYNLGKALAGALRRVMGEHGEISLRFFGASGCLYSLFRWS